MLSSLHAIRETLCRASLALVLALPPLLTAARAGAVDIELPSLGDASSASVSPQVERKLGEAWLRMFRGQVKTADDPLLHGITSPFVAFNWHVYSCKLPPTAHLVATCGDGVQSGTE